MSSHLAIGREEKVSFIRQMNCPAQSLQIHELGKYRISHGLIRPFLPCGGRRDEEFSLTEISPLGIIGFWCAAAGQRSVMQRIWNMQLQDLLQEISAPGEECTDAQVEALLTRVMCSMPLKDGMVALLRGHTLWIAAQGSVGCVCEEEGARDLFEQDTGMQIVSIETSQHAMQRAILFSSKEFCVAVHTELELGTIPNVNTESLAQVVQNCWNQKKFLSDKETILTMVWETILM